MASLDGRQFRHGCVRPPERFSQARIERAWGEDAERFRFRAKQCRELAAVARDPYSRQTLTQMADELEAEADLIGAEHASEHKPGA